MTFSAALEQLCVLVEDAITDATVHRYPSPAEKQEDQAALFTDRASTGIYHIWMLHRPAAEGVGEIGQARYRVHKFRFLVYKAVGMDVAASWLSFQAMLDTAMDAIDEGWPADNDIYDLVMCNAQNIQYGTMAMLMCHYAEIEMSLQEHLS